MVEGKEEITNVRVEMKGISSPYTLENIPILIAPIVQNQWCTNTTPLRHLSNSSVRELVILPFSQPRFTFPTRFYFSVPFPFFESTISIKPPNNFTIRSRHHLSSPYTPEKAPLPGAMASASTSYSASQRRVVDGKQVSSGMGSDQSVCG